MKYFLTSVITLFALSACSQSEFKKIDRKQVETSIKDPELPTYYPKLLARLNTFDSTLTNDDYRLIYYGYAFQPTYSPYANEKNDEIKKAFEKKDYEKVVKYCDDVIKNNPVSLKKYYYKLIALSHLEKQEDVIASTRKIYSRLIDAIISSGDGLTCNTGFKVICVSDEYEIIYRYFEIENVISQSLISPCDKMTISKTQYFPKEEMYFDVSESFLSMEKMFKKN